MSDLAVIQRQNLATMRGKVQIAAQEMMARGKRVEIPVRHYFANPGTEHGAYAREVTIPKGVMAAGEIHKTETISILSKGEVSVLTEDGVVRVRAPFTTVASRGMQRIVLAHTKCVWTTFHATRETDLEKIRAVFIAGSEQEYLDFVRSLENKGVACLGSM